MTAWTSRGDITRAGVSHTESGIPIREHYGLADDAVPSAPGTYPFTGGIRVDGYRKQPWTFRQYAGFGGGKETNARLRYLVEHGQTGLSVALDLPTQMGLDSDDPSSRYEVGRLGVAIDTLGDMEAIFDGIPIDQISTSFTINATAPVILAFYVAMADRRGVDRTLLRGTVQNDILKEIVARGAFLYPPAPSVRLCTDVIEYCHRELPKWNPISIASAHIKSAGATPVMADGFMFANAVAYCDSMLERGLTLNEFGPRLSFLTSAYRDVFESVARFRACRTFWAQLARDRFGATDERAMLFRFHSGGDIDSMTAAEPINNVARMALNGFAAGLGGCQSLQLPCYDEAYEIPTDEAVLNALRVQQIVAEESGIRYVPDPLAGSYFVEALTRDVLEQLRTIVDEVTSTGGAVRWITEGIMQAAIAREARIWEERIGDGREPRVAMRSEHHGLDGSERINVHPFDSNAAEEQVALVVRWRRERPAAAAAAALRSLDTAARDGANVIEPLVEAAKAGVTIGEASAVFERAFGRFDAPAGV